MRAVWKMRVRVLVAVCMAWTMLLGYCYRRGVPIPRPVALCQKTEHIKAGYSCTQESYRPSQGDSRLRLTLHSNNHSNNNHKKTGFLQRHLDYNHKITVYDPKQTDYTTEKIYYEYTKRDYSHRKKNDKNSQEHYNSQKYHKNSHDYYKNSQKYYKNSQEYYRNSLEYYKNSHDDKNNQEDYKNVQMNHGHNETDYKNSQAYYNRVQSGNKNIQEGPNHVQHNTDEAQHVQEGRDHVQDETDEARRVQSGTDEAQHVQEGPGHVKDETNEAQHVQEGPGHVKDETDEAQHVQEGLEHYIDTQEPHYVQEVPDPAQGGDREEVSEGTPRVILLLTTWRSGSTFLGELLATAVPDTFYSYEPLHQWKINVLHDNDSSTQAALAFLKDLFLCHLEDHAHQVAYLVRQHWYLRWNTRLAAMCHQDQGSTTTCSNATFVGQVCRNSSLHVAKVLRLGLRWVLPLLQDDDLDLQVVYLVRDPRAVLRSRGGLPWCRSSPSCRDPRQVCSSLHHDLLLLPYFLQHYPQRFKMVLYEALLEDFEASVRQLFAFLRLPLSVRHLLKAPGRRPSPLGSGEESSHHARGTYGTFRNLKYQARVWRFRTLFRDMLAAQRHCLPALRLLGLKVFTSAVQYNNHRIPILLARPRPLA